MSYNSKEKLISRELIHVDDLHQLDVSQYGNPEGIPVIIVHGGPGLGGNPYHADNFDPDKYRIIIYSQRGCGNSIPRNCLERNTPKDAIRDIETLRSILGLDKILLHGASWGSTLALLYAEAHPSNVSGLILRSIFLGDTNIIREDSKDAQTFLKEWMLFKKCIFENYPDKLAQYDSVLDEAKIQSDHKLKEEIYHKACIELVNVMHEKAKSSDDTIWKSVAAAFCRWETVSSNEGLDLTEEEIIEESTSDDGLTSGLLSIHYLAHNYGIQKTHQIIEEAKQLAKIPIYLIHGRNDRSCPIEENAFILEMALKSYGTDVKTCWTNGGHWSNSQSQSAMVKFTDEFAKYTSQEDKDFNKHMTSQLISEFSLWSKVVDQQKAGKWSQEKLVKTLPT